MTEINPSLLATQLAAAYTQPTRTRLDAQAKSAQALSTALSKLQSALTTFESALSSLSGTKGLVQYSASFSTPDYGSVSASATAQAGTYSLFVEQIATAHQLAFQDLPAVSAASPGKLAVQLADGTGFEVDFATGDLNGDGTLSQSEIARAINLAPDNKGQVTAMLVTTGGQTQLILSSANTGEGGRITLDTGNLQDAGLKTVFDADTELTPAHDAIVWLGNKDTGIKLQQASNTFTAIPGVSMTFTKAMQAGDASLTLTVTRDDSATTENVRRFVDAFNTLNKTLDSLTAAGNPQEGVAASAFASDAGVRALRNSLNSIIREEFDGLRLMDFGISADRYGVLSIDQSRLEKKLAEQPEALNTLFGNTSLTASSGLLGRLDKYLDSWLSSANGQIKRRRDSLQNIQDRINARQARLDEQYSKAYERYLFQFTKLQALQSQMGQTMDMFASLTPFVMTSGR